MRDTLRAVVSTGGLRGWLPGLLLLLLLVVVDRGRGPGSRGRTLLLPFGSTGPQRGILLLPVVQQVCCAKGDA